MIEGHDGQPFDSPPVTDGSWLADSGAASAQFIDDSTMELLFEIELARGIDRLRGLSTCVCDDHESAIVAVELAGSLAVAGRLDEVIEISKSRPDHEDFEEECLVNTAVCLALGGDVDSCDRVLAMLDSYEGVTTAASITGLHLAELGFRDEALANLSRYLPDEYVEPFSQLVSLWDVIRTDVDEGPYAAMMIADPRFRSLADEAIIERRVEMLFQSNERDRFDAIVDTAPSEAAMYAAHFRFLRCTGLYGTDQALSARPGVDDDSLVYAGMIEFGYGFGIRAAGTEPRVTIDDPTGLNTFFFQAGRNLGTARRLNELRLQRKF